jgi:23S rRNA (guanine745-N1)-methyltransferase
VCADGAHLPLTTGSLPFILNVFAPSEYEDFARVAPGGILIKVVPGERHMHELRSLVGLAEDTPDSATVLFKKRVSFISSIDVIETLHLHTEEECRAVAHMSPVGFGKLDEVDSSEGGWKDLENITTHSRILVGRLP